MALPKEYLITVRPLETLSKNEIIEIFTTAAVDIEDFAMEESPEFTDFRTKDKLSTLYQKFNDKKQILTIKFFREMQEHFTKNEIREIYEALPWDLKDELLKYHLRTTISTPPKAPTSIISRWWQYFMKAN